MEPIRLLQERGFQPVIYFANSNISPSCEYTRRLDTLKEFAAAEGIPVVEGPYDPQAWERTVGRIGDAAKLKHGIIADGHSAEFARMKEAERGGTTPTRQSTSHENRSSRETNPLDHIPSVGNTSAEAQEARASRCRACYRIRFQEAATYAAANGYPLLGTTLSVSPYQHTSIIQEELERSARQAGVQPLFEDYRPYYDNATQRSKDAGMYRQNYCGCRFSDEEATSERIARKAERKLTRVAEKLAEAKLKAASADFPYIDPAHPGNAFEPDVIPGNQEASFAMGEAEGPHTCRFHAFNTSIELIAYGSFAAAEQAFLTALSTCRAYERRLSAWLEHSDIARLNASKGEPCPIHKDTAELLISSLSYCAQSGGVFDITLGPAIRLWDFRNETPPNAVDMKKAMEHVDWRKLNVFQINGQWFAHLADPHMTVNVGGTAKGFIADKLANLMIEGEFAENDANGFASSSQTIQGLNAISINLGGNVLVRGEKPLGKPWLIGIRDPREPNNANALLGTLPLRNASAVTSGTYHRRFTTATGATYHHILSTQDGWPVSTDLASATVVAKRSTDAEGFSTTLLALGLRNALEFTRKEPRIITAILIEPDGTMHQA